MTAEPITLTLRTGPQPSRRQPQGGRGIYLSQHEHVWQECGTVDHPNGTSSVCWRCAVCTDVIYADVASQNGVPEQDLHRRPALLAVGA